MTIRTESLFSASSIASGLVSPQQIDYALRIARHRHNQQGLPPEAPIADRLLADMLVEQAVLTPYQADQLLEGRTNLTLGPYLVTDWIGQGGMGQVFKAVHQVMGRECAVKVLLRGRATGESLDNFRREIRMQAGLDCPYLVRAFDAGQDGSVHFLVTEYVPGMDLRRLVRSRGPLPLQQAAKIIMHAALGLEYAHRQGMVHRDVKPGNILVTPGGEAKVSDVGLAGFAKDFINDPRAGKIVGTTDYISPEQIRTPLEVNSASDIYSLGCTLYYAVCGKVPFPGGDTTSKLRRHLEETPWHPRQFAIDITEDFVDIIADMMEKDVTKRIANAAEVAARLEPWVSDNLSLGGMPMTRSPWMAPPLPSSLRLDSFDEREPGVGDGGTGETLRSGELTQSTSANTGAGRTGAGSSEAIAVSNQNLLAPPVIDRQAADLFPYSGLSDSSKMPLPEFASTGSASSIIGSKPASSPAPSIAAVTSTVPSSDGRLSSSMVIALTLAIAIPPALLLGAILGYLAAR